MITSTCHCNGLNPDCPVCGGWSASEKLSFDRLIDTGAKRPSGVFETASETLRKRKGILRSPVPKRARWPRPCSMHVPSRAQMVSCRFCRAGLPLIDKSLYDAHKRDVHRIGVPGGLVICEHCKNKKTLIRATRYEKHRKLVHGIHILSQRDPHPKLKGKIAVVPHPSRELHSENSTGPYGLR
jgi:hypothetical protein